MSYTGLEVPYAPKTYKEYKDATVIPTIKIPTIEGLKGYNTSIPTVPAVSTTKFSGKPQEGASAIGTSTYTFDGSSYVDNMEIGGDGNIYNTGLNNQTNDAIAQNKVQQGATMDNSSRLGLSNMYAGTKDGKHMFFDQDTLGQADPGSITSARVGGVDYGSDKENGGGTDWGYKEWGTVAGAGLGLGQLGLGVASYLDQSKTADKQRKLLDQQYSNNADLISARKAKRSNISDAFSKGL